MLENKPSQSIMTELLGQSLYEVWQALCTAINKKYDMEQLCMVPKEIFPTQLVEVMWRLYLVFPHGQHLWNYG
ncbi:DUF3788 family protein [Acutalibacter intestini]|uniref:DUF3788 family protein n=1 Tax=Acutalibacter intestini TaxID=3093659 RepID=UPI002AC8A4FE|nr:DUF3788 family protein [Acutalibacter sp. M00204]